MKPYRIVHLSDLHLTSDRQAYRSEPKLFGRLFGMDEAWDRIASCGVVQSADLVLVTGDVTDDGEFESWQVFWDGVRYAGLMDKLLVVPGNHDICCLGLRMPDMAHAQRDMARVMRGLQAGGQPTEFPWVRTPDERVAVFGFNSNNLGNIFGITCAVGYLDDQQLGQLDSLLGEYGQYPVKIVALHHSPNIPGNDTAARRGQKGVPLFDRLALQIPPEQRRKFRQVCARHKALVLHGHVHIAEDRRVNGLRIIGANASTEPVRVAGGQRKYDLGCLEVRGAKSRVYRLVVEV